MKMVLKHHLLNYAVLMLSLSFLTLLLAWSETSKTKTTPTSRPLEFLKIDFQENAVSVQTNSNTTEKQEDLQSGFIRTLLEIYPRSLFNAIREVETGGHPDPNNAEGDRGKSLGSYQISNDYWFDALEKHPEIGGTYEDVRNPYYAEMVMLAYWDRYAPDDTPETLCRIHNGGPLGYIRAATEPYWKRVQRCLP